MSHIYVPWKSQTSHTGPWICTKDDMSENWERNHHSKRITQTEGFVVATSSWIYHIQRINTMWRLIKHSIIGCCLSDIWIVSDKNEFPCRRRENCFVVGSIRRAGKPLFPSTARSCHKPTEWKYSFIGFDKFWPGLLNYGLFVRLIAPSRSFQYRKWIFKYDPRCNDE